MTETERSKIIHANYIKTKLINDFPLTDDQKLWLLEKVKRAQELEELKLHYMKQIQELTRFNDKGIKENKRLRDALESGKKAMKGLAGAVEVYSGKPAKEAMEDLLTIVKEMPD